jgi:hypothetical protein
LPGPHDAIDFDAACGRGVKLMDHPVDLEQSFGRAEADRPPRSFRRPKLKARVALFLWGFVERLFRSAAHPSAATLLEMRGWRGELPELRAIRRELKAAQHGAARFSPPPAPFGPTETDREGTIRAHPGRPHKDLATWSRNG